MNRRLAAIITTTLAVVAAACGRPTNARISAARIAEDGRTVRVTLVGVANEGQPRCLSHPTVAASVDAKSATVSVRGVVRSGSGCSKGPLSVVLSEAVNGRALLDKATGQVVRVLGVPMPEPTWLPQGWSVTADNQSFQNGDPSKLGWLIAAGTDPTESEVLVQLFRTGTDVAMRGSVVSSMITVQGRPAAMIRLNGREPGGAPSVLMMDDAWTLRVDSFNKTVDEDTIRRIADGLKPLPFATTIAAPIIETPPSGTPSSLAGIDGPVQILGWYSITPDDRAQFCESLAEDGSCAGIALQIKWLQDHPAPPGLKLLGGRHVSANATTVSG